MFVFVYIYVMDIVVRIEDSSECICKLWNEKKDEEYFEFVN